MRQFGGSPDLGEPGCQSGENDGVDARRVWIGHDGRSAGAGAGGWLYRAGAGRGPTRPGGDGGDRIALVHAVELADNEHAVELADNEHAVELAFRELLGCGPSAVVRRLASVANSTTKSINDFLAVFNSSQGAPTPELVAAEQKVLAALAPVPTQLRTLPGLRILPPSDSLAREVPALASAVEAVAAAIPQRKSAPFNDAKTGYNTHLDALKVLCP